MGEFGNYTLDELREIVDPDRPDDLGSQAQSWGACAALLSAQLDTLRTRLSGARSSWGGAAAEVFFTEMDKRCVELEEAAGTASDNAKVWSRIRDHADHARTGVFAIYEEWKNSGGSSDARDDPRRKPFDERARTVMSQVADETDLDYRRLRYQKPFTPLGGSGPDSGSSSGGSSGSDSGGGTSGGASTESAGGAPVSASGAPITVASSHGPDLQSGPPIATATPTPTPTPPPVTPAPVTPLPPPALGLPPSSAPRIGIPVRTATPPPVPRPPQRTVASVIGSRPGTTGMAPTARGLTANQVVRPVIGARPGPTGNRTSAMPNRPLIGRNGVVTGPGSERRQPVRITRAPKPSFGDRSVNRGVIRGSKDVNPAKALMAREDIRTEIRRLSRRNDRPDLDGDATESFWQPRGAVVPGVVTGNEPGQGSHDPGPVWGRREDRRHTTTDESTTAQNS